MLDWQYTETLITLRDYQTLLNQISIVLITSSGILAFKNRRLKGRGWPLGLASFAMFLGVVSIIVGFNFRSKLIDVILFLKESPPSSLTDESLKCMTLSQVTLLSLGSIVLIIAASKTPREKRENGL